MSKEFEQYNELVIGLLKTNSKELADLKSSINKEMNEMKDGFSDKLDELKDEIHELKSAKHIIKEHTSWKKDVTDVWSPPQMKESKDEIYRQKTLWVRVTGIIVGVQAIISILVLLFKK